MNGSGWPHRRQMAKYFSHIAVPEASRNEDPFLRRGTSNTAANDAASQIGGTAANVGTDFNPEKEQHTGCVIGIGLCSYSAPDGPENFLALPGDDVQITYPTAAKPPKVQSDPFTIVDFYESKMAEYDSSFVFVPIRKLQEIRGMIDPQMQVANVNAIQIRLKEGVDLNMVRDQLRAKFPPQVFRISSWQDKEGALLGAVKIELIILNLLLFLIVAVAGFGILAIFFMIVVEKTRDIGIMKSLGARGWGILGIFLTYGLVLGIAGASAGLGVGLLIVHYIDQIKDFIAGLLGFDLFDPSVYFFRTIPTIVDGLTVGIILTGAVFIAVLASILPAIRAARLHPVEALRYE
jgi:lipoprotein-releasing system permease protein